MTAGLAAALQKLSDDLAIIGSPWASYTPAWTASSSNPSLGNGTISGSYLQINKTVLFRVVLFAGSTTTFGSGTYRLSLPVTAMNSAEIINASVHLYDSSASAHQSGVATYVSASVIQFFSASSGQVNPTTPWTWANGDSIQVAGSYEAA
jgi:hypothetical protein